MNKFIFITVIILVLLACDKKKPESSNTTIKFNESVIELGSFEYNEVAEYKFKFQNSGDVPLLIYKVKSSCGCTVPIWPQKPIKPKQYDEIKITYDTSYPGSFNKTIKIFYNGEDSPIEIGVRGKVKYPNNL